MKLIKTHLKLVALFFSALIFFQGCTIYKSANVTLEEASKSETIVRVKTTNNQNLKFDKIGFENNYYYGLNHKTGDDIKIRLDENKIQKVQVKDKLLTPIINFGIPVVLLCGFIIIILPNLIFNDLYK